MSKEEAGKPRRGDYEARIVAKAWQDPRYKEALIREPRAVLGRELGIEVPEDVDVKVVEEDANTLYFVLPRDPNEYNRKELSERELSLIAGGWRFSTPCEIPSSAAVPAWFLELGFAPRTG